MYQRFDIELWDQYRSVVDHLDFHFLNTWIKSPIDYKQKIDKNWSIGIPGQ